MQHRLIIVDDHPLFRAALSATIGRADDDFRIEEAPDLDTLLALLATDAECDLVLLDLDLPGTHGLSSLLLLRAQYPAIAVMIVSATSGPDIVRQALDLGAAGYLGKSAGPAEIRRAISAVLAGDIFVPADAEPPATGSDFAALRRLATLTPQQVRVLTMLGEGLMNKQIAYALGISEATVKAHVSAILQKLDVGSRTQAVIVAGRLGNVGTPGQGDS